MSVEKQHSISHIIGFDTLVSKWILILELPERKFDYLVFTWTRGINESYYFIKLQLAQIQTDSLTKIRYPFPFKPFFVENKCAHKKRGQTKILTHLYMHFNKSKIRTESINFQSMKS